MDFNEILVIAMFVTFIGLLFTGFPVAWVLAGVGVLFAGIDVIGDYLTEVNVTSPTGIRELDKQFGINIAGLMFDASESKL